MAAPSDPRPTYDELARQYHKLLHDHEALSKRLNDVLTQVAARDGGAWSQASPGSGPQHDQLVRTFRGLYLQDFQWVGQCLFVEWQKSLKKRGKTPQKEDPAAEQKLLAQVQNRLADAILVEGSKLLGIRQTTGADTELALVEQQIFRTVLKRFEIPVMKPEYEKKLKLTDTIKSGLQLLQQMTSATPPACLLMPHGESFVPELHQAMPGCPDRGTICVKLTVFPGYWVTASNRVL
jgi:hypothetical protein